MRKILTLFVIVLGIYSCENKPKDSVTLSGKITNPILGESLNISRGNIYQKNILVNKDGSFNDTLKIVASDYRFKYGDDYGLIYLRNSNVSSFTVDTEDFYNSLVYAGDDADINNFAIENYQLRNRHFSADMTYDAKKEDIDMKINNFKAAYEELKLKFKNVDSFHIANADAGLINTINSVEGFYAAKLELNEAFPKGHPSPLFENYENHDGGTTSLSDLKGKYVYFNFWATWSSPSKREFASFKELQSKYIGKNIAFVSISVDDAQGSGSVEKAHEAWRTMVIDEKLEGIQLFADKGWKSDFIVDYKINGIPRFILIDPNGNIVSPDAPSPSNPKLVELFNSLEI